MIGDRHHGLHGHRRNMHALRNAAVVAVIVLLFIGIAVLAFSSGGALSISGSATHSIDTGSTLRFYTDSGAVFSVFLGNSSTQSAILYVSPSPVLTNPITRITGTAGESFNISVSGNAIADINIRIVSSNDTGASILLTQLPSGLSIPESRLVTIVVPAALPTSGSSAQYVATTTVSNAPTTTVPSTNTTHSTTTIQQSSQIPQTIVNLAAATNEGVLMKNLETLYAQEPQCTEPIYNQTVRTFMSTSPTGPFSYANVTASTPSSTNTVITLLPSGLYQVNYSVTVPTKSLSGTVISMSMDDSGNISGLTFLGIFKGLNYTAVESAYKTQSAVGNACAAYVQ